MDYSIDNGKTFQKYNPWKNRKVIFASSFNGNYQKLWADTMQENSVVYGTDYEVYFDEITNQRTLDKYFNSPMYSRLSKINSKNKNV